MAAYITISKLGQMASSDSGYGVCKGYNYS